MDNKMEMAMDNELDFRVGDVVCDIQYGTGKVAEVRSRDPFPFQVAFEGGKHARYQMDGRWSCLDKGRSLYHGTWEQVFGNLPVIRPKRKVKKWVNLFWDSCVGYHRVEYYPSEDRAVKDYKRMNEADYLTFKAVAVEIEVDE